MNPYRTAPPPAQGDLVRWACYECAAWPRGRHRARVIPTGFGLWSGYGDHYGR